MLAATPYRIRRRRRFFGLGAAPQMPSPGLPTLFYGGTIDQPVISSGVDAPRTPMPEWGGVSKDPRAIWVGPGPQKALWFNSAIGPTGTGQGPGVTPYPPPMSPGGAAVNTVTGGGNPLPPPVGVLPPASGASNTPVATEPSATIFPSADGKRWWPWVALGAIAAGVGAYIVSR